MLTLTGVSLASCRAQSSAIIAGTDNISVLSTGQKWISPGICRTIETSQTHLSIHRFPQSEAHISIIGEPSAPRYDNG